MEEICNRIFLATLLETFSANIESNVILQYITEQSETIEVAGVDGGVCLWCYRPTLISVQFNYEKKIFSVVLVAFP